MNLITTAPRATRYDLRTKLVYRRDGDGAWQEGQAVNVSRSGVLFRACEPSLQPGSTIEFVLELPHVGPHRHARVQCRGRIVRRCGEAAAMAIAATIDCYRFVDDTFRLENLELSVDN